MRRRVGPVLSSLAVFALLVGLAAALGACGAGREAVPEDTTAAEAPAPASGPSSPDAEDGALKAVRLTAPVAGRKARAVRDPADGRLRVLVAVRGTATPRQTLRVHASCPHRTCSRFALTDDEGRFALRLKLVLPAGLSRLAIDVDYATAPDAKTAASVKVSVRRPKARARRAPAPSPSSAPSVPGVPGTATAPAETAPPSSDGQAATPAGARRAMAVIGDSLAVGMKPYLAGVLPGWAITVDGRVGRPLAEGMTLVRSATLPSPAASVLAISLFTNDDPRGTSRLAAAVGESLDKVGANGCVIWATIARDPVGGVSYAAANALLARKAAADPRLQLVDWAGYVASHPGTLSPGEVHPGPAGYRARAGLYAAAAAGCP